MSRTSRSVAVGLFALIASAASPAAADPQFSAGLTLGPAFRHLRVGPVKPAFHLGARADVIFLRNSQRDMGLGPYVELGTSGFDAFETGGGVSWLIPAGGTSFIASGGGAVRAASGVDPVLTWGLFWGSRSYNFHSAYGFGLGLFAQGRYALGDSRAFDLVTGVQVDFAILALPFLLIVNAAR